MNYFLPSIDLLTTSSPRDLATQQQEAARQGNLIEDKTEELGSRLNIEKIDIGPSTILFNCVPVEKALVRLLPRLASEIQFELGCKSIVIHAPQPGSKFVGVEIDREDRQTVRLGDVISSTSSLLDIPLGVDTSNNIVTANIKDFPHLLIGGATSSGKTSALHSIICSLLMDTTPNDLLFWMFDTKMVELPIYENIPNLIAPIVTDAYEAVDNFQALVELMEKRYEFSKKMGAKTLDELNAKLPPNQKIPYIVVVADEIADLIMVSKYKVEETIVRLAQKSRAVGIHLIFSTQSPRREIITGLLKSNLPSRLGFATSSELDSRIIIDKNGCGKLLGAGDCLFSSKGEAPIRLQSPFMETSEIESICSYIKSQTLMKGAA